MPSVGDKIREIREKRGMTRDQLAAATKISKSFLSEVENKNKNLSSENLLKVANALGASVEYLLRGHTKWPVDREPVVIPPELSQAAEQLELSYGQTLELLEAHKSVVARRSTKSIKKFTSGDWKQLHSALKRVFG